MVEFSSSKTRLGSPDVPIKALTRKILRSQGQPNSIVGAAVEYTSAIYYSSLYPNVRDRHLDRALRRSRSLGLSEDDIEKASTFAADAIEVYGQLTQAELNLDNLSPQALAIWKEQQELSQKREREKKRNKLRTRLERNYQEVMVPTDHGLMVMNTDNDQVIRSDIVYQGSGQDTRERMRSRSLNENEYSSEYERILNQLNLIALAHPSVVFDELTTQIAALQRDQVTRRRFGEARFDQYCDLITTLLKDGSVSKERVKELGFDAKEIISRAKGIIGKRVIERSQESRFPSRMRRFGKGTDPHIFLNDGSHPHQLGYVQGWPDRD